MSRVLGDNPFAQPGGDGKGQKAEPASKADAKKTEPGKKPEAKKAEPPKAAAKKTEPPKKAEPAKAAGKKPEAKKAEPPKAAAKKAEPAKAAAKKTEPPKKAEPAKAATKKTEPPKKVEPNKTEAKKAEPPKRAEPPKAAEKKTETAEPAAPAVFLAVETIEVLAAPAEAGGAGVVDAVLSAPAPAPAEPLAPAEPPAAEAAPAAPPAQPDPPAAAPAAPAAPAAERITPPPAYVAPAPADDAALVLVPHAPAATQQPRQQRALSPLARRYRELALRGRSTFVDDFGLDPLALQRAEPALEWLYRRYFRVETEGLAHVPDHGRALLVGNRAGTLPWDSLMLSYALRREHPVQRALRPLLEDYAFHAPFLGATLNRLGAVRACQENAERLLDSEQLVGVFPEGQKGSGKRFADRYKLQRFGRGGFIKLALRTRTPILPVAIVGAEEAQPLLGKLGWLGRPLGLPHLPLTPTFPWLGPLGLLPLPSKWHIAIGEPLHLYAEYDADAADDLGLIGRLAEQVRHRIQEMLEGLLSRRRSVWAFREGP